MKLYFSLSLFALALPCAKASLLTERVMELSVTSAKLSALAYDDASLYLKPTGTFGQFQYEHPDYDEISFYTEEPDQAIVAKKDGRCYLAFRGTNPNGADWAQNLNLGDRNLYKDNNETTGEFCEGRQGFTDFLETSVVAQGNLDLLACTATCEDPSDCVVLTGHSQGGATATQASILLYSLLPIVITFGQPPAVDEGCDLIPSDRYYRYINSIQEEGEDDDLGFDPVVYSPNLISGSVQYGYPILLGESIDSVSVLEQGFLPRLFDRQNEFGAHSMAGDIGYSTRVELLYNTTTDFPVKSDGYSDGTFCSRSYHEFCASGRCNVANDCAPPEEELCVKESCVEDGDCASGLTCIYGACADGKAEIDCPCRFDRQCTSGECDQALLSFDWTCYNTTSVAPSVPVVGFTATLFSALLNWVLF